MDSVELMALRCMTRDLLTEQLDQCGGGIAGHTRLPTSSPSDGVAAGAVIRSCSLWGLFEIDELKERGSMETCQAPEPALTSSAQH